MEIIERKDIKTFTKVGSKMPSEINDRKVLKLKLSRYAFETHGREHIFKIRNVPNKHNIPIKNILNEIHKQFGYIDTNYIRSYCVTDIVVNKKITVACCVNYFNLANIDPKNLTTVYQIKFDLEEFQKFSVNLLKYLYYGSLPWNTSNIFFVKNEVSLFSIMYHACMQEDISGEDKETLLNYLDNLEDTEIKDEEKNSIICDDIIYKTDLIEIPIFEKIGNNWVFYKNNYSTYRNDIINKKEGF